jgi:hypothetical protein
MQKAAQVALLLRTDRALEQDEEIDVRTGTKMPPPVSTQRDQGDGAGRWICGSMKLPQLGVDVLRIAIERSGRPRALEDRLADGAPRFVDGQPL